VSLPSHGENRGSSPLGSANDFNDLHFKDWPVSRPCPVEIPGLGEHRLDNSISKRLSSDGVCFGQEGLGARQRQAADLTPQLAASPSDHEQGDT
jgi:hypothetical protein